MDYGSHSEDLNNCVLRKGVKKLTCTISVVGETEKLPEYGTMLVVSVADRVGSRYACYDYNIRSSSPLG